MAIALLVSKKGEAAPPPELVRTDLLNAASSTSFGAGEYAPTAFATENNSVLVVVGAVLATSTGSKQASFTIASDAGLTFTEQAVAEDDGSVTDSEAVVLKIWTAPVATGQTTTLSLDLGANAAWSYRAQAFSYVNANSGDPVGVTLSRVETSARNASLSANLSGAPASTSEVLAACVAGDGDGNESSIAPDGAWSERYDSWQEYIRVQSQTRSGSTSQAVAWGTLNAPYSNLQAAIEIKVAS